MKEDNYCAICGVKCTGNMIDFLSPKRKYVECQACLERTRGMSPKEKRKLIKQSK